MTHRVWTAGKLMGIVAVYGLKGDRKEKRKGYSKFCFFGNGVTLLVLLVVFPGSPFRLRPDPLRPFVFRMSLTAFPSHFFNNFSLLRNLKSGAIVVQLGCCRYILGFFAPSPYIDLSHLPPPTWPLPVGCVCPPRLPALWPTAIALFIPAEATTNLWTVKTSWTTREYSSIPGFF